MMPIHKLLKELRWDPQYAGSRFTIAYGDNELGLVRVPLDRIGALPAGHFMFEVLRDDSHLCAVPLHRIREVLRDAKPFWQR